LVSRLNHHSPGRVDVTPLPPNPHGGQFLKEIPNIIETGGDDKFPFFVDEAPFSFRQQHRCQTVKEVALVIEGWSDYDSASTIHEAPFVVSKNLK
jgi:hypothetical protein